MAISGNLKEKAYDYLLNFIKTCPATKNAQAIEFNVGGNPIDGLIDKIYDDNIMICVDAAGQVNPVEGGGIILGMVGGMIAGKTANKAIIKKDYSKKTLKEYEMEYRKMYNDVFEKLPYVRDFVFSLSDKEYDKIIDIANGIDFRNINAAVILKSIIKLPPKLSIKAAKLFKLFH